MNHVAVCIPSIGRSGKMLDDLIEVVLREKRVVFVGVYDNSADGLCHYKGTQRRPGLTIYQEFNEFGADFNNSAHMAFLNDDIVMAPGTLDAMAAELDGNDDLGLISVARDASTPACDPERVRRCEGTVRMGGINSWLFMVKQENWHPIDERFQIWYGDDDLVWKIRQSGKEVAALEGVTAKHEWSHTLVTIPNVGHLQAEDGRLWRSMGRP
jgi:hypothetical protein